jgi:hypothetical protein
MGKVALGVEQVSDTLFEHYAQNIYELEVLSRKECLLVLAFADTYGIRNLVQLSSEIDFSHSEIDSIMAKLEAAGFVSSDKRVPGEFKLTYAGRGILHFHRFHSNSPLRMPHSDRIETGVVKWIDKTKGYGFIELSNGEEVYFEASSVPNTYPSGGFHPPFFGIEGSQESERG